MTRSATTLAFSFAAAVLATLHGEPAQAQLDTSAFVSAAGGDSIGCGSSGTPCATLGFALGRLKPGGEILFLTPDSYAGFTITQAVSIRNDGIGEVLIEAQILGGIVIAAGAGDVVSLRGLTINGFAHARVGINIGTASAVHIQNCIVTGFQDTGFPADGGHSAFGISLAPSGRTQMFVSDTLIYNNGAASFTGGILIEPQNANSAADAVLDRVHLENNVDGILIDGAVAAGSAGSHVVVRDSVMSGNVGSGIHAFTQSGKSPAFVSVERSSMVRNGASGILADGPGATVLLSDSAITRNGTGISTINGGQLISYRNNRNNNNLGAEGAATGFFGLF